MGCPLKIIVFSLSSTIIFSLCLYILLNIEPNNNEQNVEIPRIIDLFQEESFISDIKIAKNSNCPSGYKPSNLGMWSGFEDNGCFCKTLVCIIISYIIYIIKYILFI